MFALPVLPVLLWTDLLIYSLFISVFFAARRIRHYPHLVAPWRHIFTRRRGVIAVFILFSYLIIALLDSIHFRLALPSKADQQQHYATEVVSLLDIGLQSLKQNTEKTYSAPFAITSYSKTLHQQNGALTHSYPRLQYGGSHILSGESQWSDIILKIGQALTTGLVGVLIFFSSIAVILARKAGCSIKRLWQQLQCSPYPIKTILWVVGSGAITVYAVLFLSQYYHVLGTDKVGQDVLYQTIKSIRTGIVIGTLTTLVMLPLAIGLGVMAGFFRGWIDDLIQYLYTTLNSIPGVLLIAAAVLMLQVYMTNNAEQFTTIAERADMRLLALCIILGMTSWTGLCRILRAETLKLREAEYVQAAKVAGLSHWQILKRHIVPNVMHLVIVAIVLDFSGLVLAEAVLSYVGVGVDPSMISWGNMINSARLEMAREPVVWWSLMAAFLLMFILVLAANLFADTVRDAFDPRVPLV